MKKYYTREELKYILENITKSMPDDHVPLNSKYTRHELETIRKHHWDKGNKFAERGNKYWKKAGRDPDRFMYMDEPGEDDDHNVLMGHAFHKAADLHLSAGNDAHMKLRHLKQIENRRDDKKEFGLMGNEKIDPELLRKHTPSDEEMEHKTIQAFRYEKRLKDHVRKLHTRFDPKEARIKNRIHQDQSIKHMAKEFKYEKMRDEARKSGDHDSAEKYDELSKVNRTAKGKHIRASRIINAVTRKNIPNELHGSIQDYIKTAWNSTNDANDMEKSKQLKSRFHREEVLESIEYLMEMKSEDMNPEDHLKRWAYHLKKHHLYDIASDIAKNKLNNNKLWDAYSHMRATHASLMDRHESAHEIKKGYWSYSKTTRRKIPDDIKHVFAEHVNRNVDEGENILKKNGIKKMKSIIKNSGNEELHKEIMHRSNQILQQDNDARNNPSPSTARGSSRMRRMRRTFR